MSDDNALAEYSDENGHTFLLTAAEAKARGAKPVQAKAAQPRNKAVKPSNKEVKPSNK